MSTERLTAEQWANLYGWQSSSSGFRFWMLMLVVLVAGLGVGMIALPRIISPTTTNANLSAVRAELATAQAQVDQLEQEISFLEEVTFMNRLLVTAANDRLESVNAETGQEMVAAGATPALVYIVRDQETETCSDFLVLPVNDNIKFVNLGIEYACAGP